MYHAAFPQLGRNTSLHKNWFDENDEESESCLTKSAKLLEHINKKAALPPIKQPNIPTKKVQSKLRETQDSDGIQYDADNNNT